jgi:membrane protease subunit HflK
MQFNVKPGMIVIIIVAVVVLALLSTSVYIVDQTERGVITLFGKFSKIAEPGLHFKIPFGIEQNYNIATEVINVEQFGFKTEKAGIVSQYDESAKPIAMLTGDLNVVQIEWIVQYKIIDPRAWQFNLQNRNTTIRDMSISVINQLVGDASFTEITTSARVRIEGEALILMNQTFKDLGIGINVIAVKFQNVEMPEAVKAAFSDVSNAKTDALRMINEGKEEYNAVIPKAQGEASQLILKAEGYASVRINKAKGDVDQFLRIYAEYLKAPSITKQRLYLEMVEQVFGSPDEKVDLIDKRLGNFLPLKNLTSPEVKK